jgi:hypothetical protein
LKFWCGSVAAICWAASGCEGAIRKSSPSVQRKTHEFYIKLGQYVLSRSKVYKLDYEKCSIRHSRMLTSGEDINSTYPAVVTETSPCSTGNRPTPTPFFDIWLWIVNHPCRNRRICSYLNTVPYSSVRCAQPDLHELALDLPDHLIRPYHHDKRRRQIFELVANPLY